MGLGYQGWVKVDDKYALGTGMSVPRARPRLESAAGYGGKISSPPSEMGVGLPYNYDYEVHDGNLNFEVDLNFYRDVLIDWLFDRQAYKEISFSTRNDASQYHEKAWFSGITITASVDAALDGSLQFVSLGRSYDYGSFNIVKLGNDPADSETSLCPDKDFPYQLNPDSQNLTPVPFWNTKVKVEGNDVEFTTWTMSFSQDVVKFFACEHNTSAQPPKYLAVGPMSVLFSGQYIRASFFADHINEILVQVGDTATDYKQVKLKRCEQNTYQDDLQPPDGVTWLEMEYTAYEIENV